MFPKNGDKKRVRIRGIFLAFSITMKQKKEGSRTYTNTLIVCERISDQLDVQSGGLALVVVFFAISDIVERLHFAATIRSGRLCFCVVHTRSCSQIAIRSNKDNSKKRAKMNKSGDSADSAKKVNGTDQQQPTGIVQPSYRKLQDADSNWKVNGDQIEMAKQNGTDADIDDGAQEKMLKDEPKTVVTPAKNSTEVCLSVSDPFDESIFSSLPI